MFSTSLIVLILYSASLTSFLACHKTVMPFEDSHSLYYSTDMKVATVKGVSYLSSLKGGNEVEKKIFQERMILVSRSAPNKIVLNCINDLVSFYNSLFFFASSYTLFRED